MCHGVVVMMAVSQRKHARMLVKPLTKVNCISIFEAKSFYAGEQGFETTLLFRMISNRRAACMPGTV
jgi:hypothetical protein